MKMYNCRILLRLLSIRGHEMLFISNVVKKKNVNTPPKAVQLRHEKQFNNQYKSKNEYKKQTEKKKRHKTNQTKQNQTKPQTQAVPRSVQHREKKRIPTKTKTK